jgi:phospholipase C
MANENIFGFREEMWGEISGDRVHVRKRHIRTARDAAVPPGQAVEFEFYVALFPFGVLVLQTSDDIHTTERRTPARPVRRDVAPVAPIRASELAGPIGVAPVRAAELASPLDLAPIRAGAHGGPIIMARRRPLNIPGIGDGLDFDLDPTPPDPPPPPPDFVVPFEITLTPPNGLAPIVFTNPKYSQIKSWPSDNARIDPAFIERARGKWHISVKNINADARRMEVQVTSTHAVTAVGHQDIPLSLLNNLSSVALQKALPTIEYDRGNVVISTPTHFLDLMGVDRVYSLGSIAAKIIDGLPTFTPFWARLMSRADFIARLTTRKAEIVREFTDRIRVVGVNHVSVPALRIRMNNATNACDKAIQRLQAMTDTTGAFCLVLEGMFTNPEVDLRYVGTVAEIENRIPQLGLVFNNQLGFTDVISTLAIDLSPALAKIALTTGAAVGALALLGAPVLALFALVGGILLYNSIDDVDLEGEIRQKIRDKGPAIAGYVKRALERITDHGAVALRCKINPRAAADGSDLLHIEYFNPSKARPPRPWRPIDDVVGGMSPTAEVLEISPGEVTPRPARAVTLVRRSTARSAPYVERLTGLARERPGPVPSDFTVPNRETLARLDDHDCIAVLMMENRSYDHFFHDLPRAFPGKGYQGAPASYRNTAAPGFSQPFSVVRNTSIGIGNSLIFRFGGGHSDPSHNYDHTVFQLGGGTDATIGSGVMRGFAADFGKKSDSPQIVMSYFSIDDLPVYKGLVKNYPVCDRWFAALPVGTFPNRLAALQGNVPFLYNIKDDDPALGYLEDYSIFDLLSSQDISWKFFESDIGTIRLYDRYRLDVRNVRPIGALDRTLQQAAAGGGLPRVLFIEPQFLYGNDDHPPMDVQQGQNFIRHVVGKFIQHGLLDRTLFVITYDEHGGFFDHVPPPGTPANTSRALRQPVESLFPQDPAVAPTSFGIRVPSLVLSKWTANRANHTLLDHTAILKTILLHNRAAISTAQFGKFGERVKKRGHLGQVLERTSPRTVDYTALASDIGYRLDTGPWWSPSNALVASRAVGMTQSHPANVVRGIALPRGRVIAE